MKAQEVGEAEHNLGEGDLLECVRTNGPATW